MRGFDCGTLASHLADLVDLREWCHWRDEVDGSGLPIGEKTWKHVQETLAELETFASDADFPTLFAVVSALNLRVGQLGKPPAGAAVHSDLSHVIDMLIDDANQANFLRVPPQFTRFVDNPALFGPDVARAFPSAMEDLRQAGNCLAADCNTAAVFHMMRAVEWALRALAVHLGFRQLKVIKKSGVKKIVPLSHLEWEKVLDQLQVKIDRKVEAIRPGKRKQELQEFYYPVVQEIRAIRDAWRNHVMHTRATYGNDDALAARGESRPGSHALRIAPRKR